MIASVVVELKADVRVERDRFRSAMIAAKNGVASAKRTRQQSAMLAVVGSAFLV